jgi:hypothetical protein
LFGFILSNAHLHILWHKYFNPCMKKYGQVEDATKFEMKLSAISPLTSIAYSIRDPSLLAGIVSYQPIYQHCLQHQGPQLVGRYSQLSAISPLISIAYSIRDPSLLAGTHSCQLSAHLPALPTASGTPVCWQVLSAISPLTSIAYSIRNPSLLAGTHNCQLSAHLPA